MKNKRMKASSAFGSRKVKLKPMASSSEEVAVFTDTNLGTHIAMAVSPDITAGDFKKELERRHFSCFPKIGEITVCGLLVKQKSNFYHLPNSVPIKHVFQGLKGTWYLRVEAKALFDSDGSGLYPCIDATVGDHHHGSDAADSVITSTEKNGVPRNGKNRRIASSHVLSRTVPLSKRKRKKDKRVESITPCNSSPSVEISSQRALKAVPAAGYVGRCLSNLSNVSKLGFPHGGDTCRGIQSDSLLQFTIKTPPRTLSLALLTNSSPIMSSSRPGGPQVGKRVVEASKNISISAHKTSPTISLCKFKNGKWLGNYTSPMPKYLVYEISDNDD